MATALAIGRPGPAALAWAAAAAFAFLAHEPAMVLLGQRGAKASREERHRARRWLGGYVMSVALLGAPAVALMPADARAVLFVPLSLGLLLAAVIGVGREHTPGGEVLSALVMASLAWPAALASGVPPVAARTCAVVFAAGFAAATLAVHAVIARTRRPPAVTARLTAMLAVVVIAVLVGAGAQLQALDRAASAAVAPMLCGAVALAWAAPPARRLRTVGWTLVAVSLATAGLTVAILRT
jgi:hypothetical protein